MRWFYSINNNVEFATYNNDPYQVFFQQRLHSLNTGDSGYLVYFNSTSIYFWRLVTATALFSRNCVRRLEWRIKSGAFYYGIECGGERLFFSRAAQFVLYRSH